MDLAFLQAALEQLGSLIAGVQQHLQVVALCPQRMLRGHARVLLVICRARLARPHKVYHSGIPLLHAVQIVLRFKDALSQRTLVHLFKTIPAKFTFF